MLKTLSCEISVKKSDFITISVEEKTILLQSIAAESDILTIGNSEKRIYYRNHQKYIHQILKILYSTKNHFHHTVVDV